MPGIVGILSLREPEKCQEILSEMVASMKNEKSLSSGYYIRPHLGLYIGWVSAKSPNLAPHPIVNEHSDIVLFFEGECFSDKDICSDLITNGHRFEKIGTSWLVHYYEERGIDFLKDINGCFSGFLVDSRINVAFLFNDRYGIERIYYHFAKQGFFFASEAKALLRVHSELKAFNTEALVEYIGVGCCLGWKSLFNKVSILPSGSRWALKPTENGYHIKREEYFSPSDWEVESKLTLEEYMSKFIETFSKVIPRYLESATGIGISLTGGYDTRMITACLRENDCFPITYTFCGKNGKTKDAQIAELVANALGLKHFLLRIEEDFFSGFKLNADNTVYITDGTLGVCGTHEIYLNAKAKNLSPVRLTGNFGSEILRGISTFKPIKLTKELFSDEFYKQLAEFTEQVDLNPINPVSFAAFKEIPWSLFGTVKAAKSQILFRTPYLDNELVKLAFRAPIGLDKLANIIKILIRKKEPFLANILTDRGDSIGSSSMSGVIKRLISITTFKLDYYLNEGMPNGFGILDELISLIDFKNIIFGSHKYLFYRKWFRQELFSYVYDRINEACLSSNPIWNIHFLKKMAHRHRSGYRNYVQEINAVLTIEAIERLFLNEHNRKCWSS